MQLLEGVTVNVLRKGATDIWGDGESGAGEYGLHHTIDGVLVQADSESADNTGRNDYLISGQMYMPLGSDVLATDQVQIPAANTITGWATVKVQGRPYSYDYGLVSGVAVRFREVANG